MADITVPETGDNAPADAFDTNAPLFNPQTTGPIPDQNDAFGGKVEAPKPLADVNFYTAQDDLAQRAAKATEEGDMQKAARIRAVAEHFSTSRYQAEQELDYRERVIQRENAQKLLAQTPGTAQRLAANPLDAPIFKNDLGALGTIEKIFEPVSVQPKIDPRVTDDRFREYRQITGDYDSDPESSTGDPDLDAKINMIRLPGEYVRDEISRGYEAGKASSERGLLYYGLLNGTADNTSEDFKKYDAELERRIKAASDAGTDGLLYNAAQFVGSMVGSAPGGMNEAAGAGIAALGVGLMTQGAGLTATGAGAIPGITMTALGGLMTGALWYSASQKVESGLELQTLLSQGADPDTARFISQTVGGINGLIEVGLTAAGAKAAAPVMKAITNAATAKTVAALAEPSVRKTVLKGLQAYGAGVAGEVLTEVMQEAVSAYGEEAGRILANSKADPLELNALADRLADTAVNTLKGAALLGAGPAGISTLTAATRVSVQQGNAQATKAWAERLNEAMPQVQAMQESPSAVHQFVEAQADKSGLNNIYVDADTFKQVATAAGMTEEQLQQTLPAIADQLKRVDGQSRDVVIPVADYATQIAGTPLGERLTEHIRRNADDLSFAETKRANDLTREFLVRLSTDPKAAEREIAKAETKQNNEDRRDFQERRKTGYIDAGWTSEQASMAAQYEGLVLANLAQRTGLPFRTLETRAPKINLTTADGQTMTLGEPGSIQQIDRGRSPAVEAVNADQKLRSESEQWGSLLDGLTQKPTQPVLMLKQTPLAMNLVGANFRELRVHPHVFDGIFQTARRSSPRHNAHPEMTKEVLKQIPQALTDPIAVFSDNRRAGSYVFMLEVLDAAGHTVLAPVQFEATGGKGTINLLKTAYGQDRPLWFSLRGSNNEVVYVNREKIKRWFPTSGVNSLFDSSALPAAEELFSNADGSSVLTEQDLARAKQERTDLYQYSGEVQANSSEEIHQVSAAEGARGQVTGGDANTLLQTAYHGSAATFDHFDMSKIGSGTGDMAHGWGIYFAMDRKSADEYREMLSTEANEGHLYEADIPGYDVLLDEGRKFFRQPKAVKANLERLMQEQFPSIEPQAYRRWDGWEIYSNIKRALKDARPEIEWNDLLKETSKLLNAYGIPGLTFKLYNGEYAAVVFDDRAIKILEVFQQSQEEIRGGFSPSSNTITLNRNSDLSTVAHELGHWYLETLFDLSKVEGVDATITEDTQALLKEFGFDSVDAWQAASVEARRKAHEQFAHWTELYLATGKAPVPTLKRFFQRFGAMIRAVYESIREGTQGMAAERIRANYKAQIGEDLPDIPPEVRRALDRMLASQQALSLAEDANSLKPLFEQKPKDMSDEQWRELQRDRDDAFNEGTERITAAQAKDEKWLTGARSRALKEIQKKGAEARKKIRAEVETDVNSIPGVVALDIISAGSRSKVTINLRLREEDVKALGYSEKNIAKLKARGVFQKRNAVPLSYARETLKPFARFNTDKQMIDAMLDGLDARDGIDKEVDRRMLAEHSDLVTPEGQAKLLTQALHNEARSRMVATELRYLMQGQAIPSRVLVAAARKAAEDRLSQMKIRDLSVKQILGWEGRASRKAFDALKAGDRLGASMAKREQLVWHEAVSLALDIDSELRGMRDLRSKIFKSDKELAKSRDTGYIAVARYVLTNVGLGKGRAADLDPSKAQEFVKKLASYDPEKYNTFSDILMRFAYRPDASFQDMTLIDARDAMDAVRMLWKQAGDERKLDLGERKANLDEVVGELVDAAAAHDSGKVPEGTFKRQTQEESFFAKLRTEKLKLLRVENWCVRMDSGDADGPFQSYIYRPMAEAAARYRNANIEYQKKLTDLIRPMVEGWQKFGAIDAPELRYTFSSKAELIGMLLHTGNASNKEKLLLGGRGNDNRWADQLLDENGNVIGIDTSRFDSFIARCYSEGIITKEDMDFVQAVWDLLEELKPLSQNAYNRMYGYYFEEVPAESIITPWGIYRGGYVPAKADRALLAEQTRYEEQDFMLNASSFASAMPVRKPGFTMSRVDVHNPLDFDLSRLCAHLSQSLKFAYMGPTAIQVSKILNDKRFASAVDKVDKGVDMALLRPWLDRTYQQRVSEPSDSWVGSKLNSLRGLAGMNVMALNFNNTLQQITGFSVAAAEVPAKELAHALSLYFKGSKKLVQDMCEASPFMKARLEDRAIEYQSEIEMIATMDVEGVAKAKGVIGKTLAVDRKLEPVRQWAARHAYVLQRIVQNNMDTVIWTAARNHGEAIGTANPEAYADSVVRRTQSDFAPENIAGIEASGPLMRFVLVFYNYFGMQYNLLGDKWAAAKATKQYGRFALDAALIAWIPAVLSELIARALTGEGLDVDDDDDIDAWDLLSLLLGPLLKNFISMIPVAGSILNIGGATAAQDEKTGALSTAAQFVYGSDPYVGKMLSTPALQLIGSSGSMFLDAARALNGEEVNVRSATRNFLDLTTLLTGVPTGPLKKPLGYAAGLASGQIDADSAADIAAGLYTGKAPDQ